MNKPKHQSPDLTRLQLALQHHQAGRLEQAEAIYKNIRNNSDALNLQGLIAYQTGRNDEALALIGKAIATKPSHAVYHFNLGLVYQAQKRLDETIAAYRKAVTLQPDFLAAHNNLGLVLQQRGQLDEAVACFRRAIALSADYAEAHNNLGQVLQIQGKAADALACFQRAIQHAPDYLEAHYNLGLACKTQPDKAAACYRKVLALKPDFPEAHNNLGAALQDLGRLEEAVPCFLQALALKPDYAQAHYNLGIIRKTHGMLEEAITCYRHAIDINPDYAVAHNNLGDIFRNQGRLDEAIACFRQALRSDPSFAYAQSNLLFCINYHPTLSAQEIFSAYRQWSREHAAQYCLDPPSFSNDRAPQRRLRVGYVSPDFHQHPVIHFAAPLLELRDRAGFELFCYYNNTVHDAYTERMMAASDHWIMCKALSDDELAQRIRADRIDILIDLAGHTADNRLLVFARKPAPVQASWLGFGYTTGLTAMDYFIGDPVFTPPGAESLFSETLLRLPHAAWAYQPPEGTPDIAGLPAARRGYVTFACLSRSERINARVIAAWADLLRRLPSARLRLDNRNFNDAGLRSYIETQFAAHGVPAARLEISCTSPVWNVYQDVDIVLDCFPHNSGTTTYEALWMGVPVITLADRPSVGRLGASILSCIGKPEWIAAGVEDYVDRALALAQNVHLLAHERASLRQTMLASPLLDQAGFTRDMEVAYRDMWHRWCKN